MRGNLITGHRSVHPKSKMKERSNLDSVYSWGAPNHIQSDLRRLFRLNRRSNIQTEPSILIPDVSEIKLIIFPWKSKVFRGKINLTPSISFKFLIWKFHTVFSAIFWRNSNLNSKNCEYALIYKKTKGIDKKTKVLVRGKAHQNRVSARMAYPNFRQRFGNLKHLYREASIYQRETSLQLEFWTQKLFSSIERSRVQSCQSLKKTNIYHRFRSILDSANFPVIKLACIHRKKAIGGIEKRGDPDLVSKYSQKHAVFCPGLYFLANKWDLKPSINIFSLC